MSNSAEKPRPKKKKEMTRAERAAVKAERQALERAKRLAAANVESDPRLANARRTIVVAGLGKWQVASVAGLPVVLPRKADRTPARTIAWAKFDELCHKANAGLIAEPRFEQGVDCTKIPGVPDSRIDATREEAGLRAYLGPDYFGLLFLIIYLRKSYGELEAEGLGSQRAISIVFKLALDRAASYWGIHEENSFGAAVNRIFATFDEDAAAQRKGNLRIAEMELQKG